MIKERRQELRPAHVQSVDSYPGGFWRGVFKVSTRIYGVGKLYGYNGTFAAGWCQLK